MPPPPGETDWRNVLEWKARAVQQKVASTMSAELLALRDAVKRAWHYVNILRKLRADFRVEFMIDSAPLRDQLASGISRSEPQMQGCLEFVREQINELRAHVHKVHSECILADTLTKPLFMNA